jgi:ABC-2 type transport system ATP-binding protein
LTESGVRSSAYEENALRTEADAELIGKIALQAGVPLLELRSADGAGLEEMFLELTAETQREGAAA